MSKALLVIDLQNDYFPGGVPALERAEATLAGVERAIARARDRHIPIILVQHVADAARGVALFFNEGTSGAVVHPQILAAAPDAPVVEVLRGQLRATRRGDPREARRDRSRVRDDDAEPCGPTWPSPRSR